MSEARRILIVCDLISRPVKMFLNQAPKLAKGFIRLGNDVRLFSYAGALKELSPFKSKFLTGLLYKQKADHILDLVEKGGYKAPWITD
jgi:hypothetical protein